MIKFNVLFSIDEQTKTGQFSIEIEPNNLLITGVHPVQNGELPNGVQFDIADVASGRPLKNITPSANPPALVEAVPNENATQVTNPPALVAAAPNNNVVPGNQETWQTAPVAPKRKQRPGGLASEKQLKYLNDLLALNGLNLAVWCKEKGVPKDQIRAVHCQQWIPELKDRQKNNGWPT